MSDDLNISEMTEREVLDMAMPLLPIGGLKDKDYAEVVRVLTTANYVADLCIRVLGDRGEIEFYNGNPAIPDARPESMIIENVLVSHEEGRNG